MNGIVLTASQSKHYNIIICFIIIFEAVSICKSKIIGRIRFLATLLMIFHDDKGNLNGYIYHNMRTSRVDHKQGRSAIDDFWGNIRKVNSGSAIQAYTIDGYLEEANITVFWKISFSNLDKFDAVLYSKETMFPNN